MKDMGLNVSQIKVLWHWTHVWYVYCNGELCM